MLFQPGTARHRLPAVYPYHLFVSSRGLMSYRIDTSDPFRRAAGYVDRILKREKPADLPLQQPTKFEMAISLRTAKALGTGRERKIMSRSSHRNWLYLRSAAVQADFTSAQTSELDRPARSNSNTV